MATQRQPAGQTNKKLSIGSRLFFTTPEVAALFGVCNRTVLRWASDGLLKCRYQYFGGSFCRRVYLTEEIGKLIDEFFPTKEDLDFEHPPGPRKQRVEAIKRLRGMSRLFAGKARAAKLTKRLTEEYGIAEDELDNESAEPAILDRGSARRRDIYSQPPSGLDPGLAGDSDWDDGFEPRR